MLRIYVCIIENMFKLVQEYHLNHILMFRYGAGTWVYGRSDFEAVYCR